MVDLVPLLIAAGAIVLWSLVLYALQRRGLLEPRGLQPSPPPAGPFLTWKTVRGRQWIDRGLRGTPEGRAAGLTPTRSRPPLRGRPGDEHAPRGPLRGRVLLRHAGRRHAGPRRSRDRRLHAGRLPGADRGDANIHGDHVR